MKKQKFEVSPEAQNDINDAIVYHENKKDGLGLEFHKEVKKTFDIIENNPFTYQIVVQKDQIRRGLTHRFKYGIFYIVTKMKIMVTRVIHTSRSPEEWTKK